MVRSRPRLRGHSTSMPRAASAPTPWASRLTSSSVSRVIWSGTRSSSSRSSTGHASAAARRAIEAWVRARSPNPWLGRWPRLGPEQCGVAHVERVLLVVDLQHQPHRTGEQLFLVGLDPQRDPHQLGRSDRPSRLANRRASRSWKRLGRGACAVDAASASVGRRPGHRVGDGVEHRPDRGLVARISPTSIRTRSSSSASSGAIRQWGAPAVTGSRHPAATSRSPSSAEAVSSRTLGGGRRGRVPWSAPAGPPDRAAPRCGARR